MSKHTLKGSEREPAPGARAVGKADPTERLEVSVLLRRSQGDTFKENVKKLESGDKSHAHLKREEFAQKFGAAAADIAAVKKFASSHGLSAVQEDGARRTVRLAGTVAQFNEAFGVDLGRFEYPGGSYRGRTGPVKLPDSLNGIVEAVLGLDNRPQARPHVRVRPAHKHKHSAAASFDPNLVLPLVCSKKIDDSWVCGYKQTEMM
jgi:kumamolisin